MPKLSIVIPTLARRDVLARALGRLADQDPPGGEFEVIVVADAQEPDPDAVAATVGTRPYPVRTLRASIPGASAARNAGWREARSSLILFVDDDVLAGHRLVAEHLEWHRRAPAAEVGVLGSVRWAGEVKVTAFMRWLESGMLFHHHAIRGTDAGWGRFYTANASVKRELLERAGGFDEQRFPYLYEDLDLAYRMRLHGFRLLYNRRAIAEHLHSADLESWRRRMPVLAAAERRFVEIHPEIRPYFRDRFAQAAAAAPARGRAARLAGVVPPRFPVLGPRVWGSLGTRFLQELAPDFLAAWERAGESPVAPADHTDVSERAASSGGSEPCGPK